MARGAGARLALDRVEYDPDASGHNHWWLVKLLLAVLHAVVFLEGSGSDVLNPVAAQEQLELIAACLQRLDGSLSIKADRFFALDELAPPARNFR